VADNLDHQNYEKIKGKFVVLLIDVCKKLQNRDINVDGFRLFIVALFPPGDCIPKSSDLHHIFRGGSRNLRRGVLLKGCARSAPKNFG